MKQKEETGFKMWMVCVAVLTIWIVGCNRENSSVKPAPSKRLIVAISESPTTSDPVLALDVGSTHLPNSMHAPLIVVGQDSKLVMVLADSVTMAQDGLSCEINLKPAKFWDGKRSPVTAEDVRYSFERVRASAHPHKWILDRIAGVTHTH